MGLGKIDVKSILLVVGVHLETAGIHPPSACQLRLFEPFP